MAEKPKRKATGSAQRKQPAARKKQGSAASRGGKKAGAKKRGASRPKDICFVISPFGGWHDTYFSDIFCPAIESAGLEPKRADDLFRSSNIVHDIWHFVVSARVLIADLTGKNPNVFYELGLAHAARKPVLLLTRSMEDVPFDLRALRVILYEVENPSWADNLRDQIKQGLEETLESPERSVLPTFLLEEPGDHPEVSKEEARLLDLQQQVDSLRAELRHTRRPDGGSRISALEARDLIAEQLEAGMPTNLIVARVSRLGPPPGWVEQEVARQIRRMS